MEGVRRRWPSGKGIRVTPKTKRLRKRVRGFFRLLRSWCCRRRPLVREDDLYYTPLRCSNSFYADAIADCIDFIKRSS
ncbi:hypothetical protein EUTSA_v10005230mg [Eutrema salsugineum]|uniref:Uncharacterized protein n=1 Tax=Eutrema salsugineum TaxID=72664 RepID=V4KIR8_EUTSA|nr:hypothetical protein EUTSA_v10005230mg [Eutrema salsugineum]